MYERRRIGTSCALSHRPEASPVVVLIVVVVDDVESDRRRIRETSFSFTFTADRGSAIPEDDLLRASLHKHGRCPSSRFQLWLRARASTATTQQREFQRHSLRAFEENARELESRNDDYHIDVDVCVPKLVLGFCTRRRGHQPEPVS